MTKGDIALDRDRGFLTKKDREYLLNQIAYDGDQQDRNRRRYIRNRIQNALIDFTLLSELDERDLVQIASNLEYEEFRDSESNLNSTLCGGLINGISFFYLLMHEADLSFEEMIRKGIRDVEKRRAGAELMEIDVDISIDRESPENTLEIALTKIRNGNADALTENERQTVLDQLHPDSEEIDEAAHPAATPDETKENNESTDVER